MLNLSRFFHVAVMLGLSTPAFSQDAAIPLLKPISMCETFFNQRAGNVLEISGDCSERHVEERITALRNLGYLVESTSKNGAISVPVLGN